MSEPKNKKKSRSGHKSYLTHALNKVDEYVANYTPQRKDELAQWKESLQEQLQKVTTLSDQILALMEAHEELTDDLSTEFMDTNTLKFDVTMRLSATEKIVIANVANVTNVPPSLPSPSADLPANQAPFNPWPVPQTATLRAKLPKLEVWKFGGNISEWQEFWDLLRHRGAVAVQKTTRAAPFDHHMGRGPSRMEPGAVVGCPGPQGRAARGLQQKRETREEPL